MTTVVSLGNIPTSSPQDVSVYLLNQANLTFQKQVVSSDGLTVAAYYVYASGDPSSDTLVTVTQRQAPNQGLVHTTVRLETMQTVTVDSVVTEERLIACTLGISTPGTMEDTAKVLSMIGSTFSLFFGGLTSKVPDADVINKMNFGVINSLYP
jgi:hypothetical protein